ncbi:MAG TPA: helix-turn-helix domain-containing protein [Anaerolineae bacterium]|nr:helix-turn-helix domain-containing protein [Anaerolineae bacterium]HNU02766.1 helix-turn-helix domain-containing protein [Anaerolineae bacterium]
MNDPDAPVYFGEWLKRRRQRLDLTQGELAERVGYSVFALRKIESGERRPSKQLAGLLADALEIPPAERPTFLAAARGEVSSARLSPAPARRDAPLAPPRAPESPAATPAASPALSGAEAPGLHNWPASPTPLVGREEELASLARLLIDPLCRLLTLIGPGGIGKTRLAVAAAAQVQGCFADGVWFAPLAPVAAPAGVIPALAEALGLTLAGQAEIRLQLLHYLAGQEALLVVDNLEHLLASAGLLAEILARAPGVKLLATSRERLNLQGEYVFVTEGLATPSPDQLHRAHDYDAIRLFTQAARRAGAQVDLQGDELTAAAQVCRAVEGMPLGIELAAAWTPLLSCREIAVEIQRGLDFLSTDLRDLPERQRSLAAVFEHSWRLLTDEERAVLAQLAIFQGGFERDAAAAVAGASLPTLRNLASKSLIRRTETGRYDLHEAVRQYALKRLEEDQARCRAARERHCEYFMRLAATHEARLKGAGQQEAIRDLTVEVDNLRAAWGWGVEYGKFETVGKAARAFGWYYEVTGLIHEGIGQMELLGQALSELPRQPWTDKILGACLVQQSLLYFRAGDFAQATERYARAISLLRAVGDQTLLADALIFSGSIHHLSGAYLESRTLIEEGLVYARAINDRWFSAYGVYNIGHVDSIIGDYQKGYAQMQEGLALWRALGDPHSISLGLNFLVETQITLGKTAEAIAAMQESIALCERTQNRWGMGTAYRYLGLATLATGDSRQAIGQLEKSLETFGQQFKGWDIAQTLIYLGEAYLHLGDAERAKAILLDALRLAREIHSAPLMLQALAGLATLELRAALDGAPRPAASRAAGWLSLILSHPAAIHTTKARAAQLLGDLGLSPASQAEEAAIRSLEATVDAVICG